MSRTSLHLLPRWRLRIGPGGICLGPWAIRLGLEAGSIGAPLDPTTAGGLLKTLTIDICRAPRTSTHGIGLGAGSIGAPLEPGVAAGRLLKTLAVEICLAPRTTTHGIGLEPGSIGAPLQPGAAAGTPLKTAAIVICLAPRTTTHGIGLEAGTIGTRLEPGAATEPLSGHGAVITRSLGSAIEGALPRRVSPGIAGAATSDVGRGWRCVIGHGCTGVAGVTTTTAAITAAATTAA